MHLTDRASKVCTAELLSDRCSGRGRNRRMKDGKNQLFREYVRLLRGLQPKVLVMKNVGGIVKGR